MAKLSRITSERLQPHCFWTQWWHSLYSLFPLLSYPYKFPLHHPTNFIWQFPAWFENLKPVFWQNAHNFSHCPRSTAVPSDTPLQPMRHLFIWPVAADWLFICSWPAMRCASWHAHTADHPQRYTGPHRTLWWAGRSVPRTRRLVRVAHAHCLVAPPTADKHTDTHSYSPIEYQLLLG